MIDASEMSSPSDSPSPAVRRRRRRGVALVLTLVVVVVLALLSSAAVVGSTQEYRGGRNALVEQRAFAVAEFGLNSEIANWNRDSNLIMNVGNVRLSSIFVANGDTAMVYIQRFSPTTYWVRSLGRASIGNAQLEAQRETNMFVRIAYPSVRPGAAIVTAGVLRVRGNPTVDGRNTNPPGWGPQCASIPGRDTFAIAHAPGNPPNISGGASDIINGINSDPAAADSNTYVRYGTETWNSLVANANLRVNGGTFSPTPTAANGRCDLGSQTNWGEPRRGVGAVAECATYFPIIYSSSSIQLNGNGRGQGILLVNGDLRINGTMDWIGLIIVRDDIDAGNGTARVYGSVMARNALVDNDLSALGGTADFFWSKCAVESALRGSAILTRTKERSWSELF